MSFNILSYLGYTHVLEQCNTYQNWVSKQEPVTRVSNKARLKLVSSATETR